VLADPAPSEFAVIAAAAIATAVSGSRSFHLRPLSRPNMHALQFVVDGYQFAPGDCTTFESE
jgi:hypothetical protein